MNIFIESFPQVGKETERYLNIPRQVPNYGHGRGIATDEDVQRGNRTGRCQRSLYKEEILALGAFPYKKIHISDKNLMPGIPTFI